jgi:hypothetical protein
MSLRPLCLDRQLFAVMACFATRGNMPPIERAIFDRSVIKSSECSNSSAYERSVLPNQSRISVNSFCQSDATFKQHDRTYFNTCRVSSSQVSFNSNVEHGLPEPRMDLSIPLAVTKRARIRCTVRSVVLLQCVVQVRATTRGQDVGVVSRRDVRDSLRGTTEEVAELMGDLLKAVGVEPDVVFDDNVVSRTRGALQALMGLQVELVVGRTGDAAVDDSARLCVQASLLTLRVEIRIFQLGGVKPRVVAFADDNDRHLRPVCLLPI